MLHYLLRLFVSCVRCLLASAPNTAKAASTSGIRSQDTTAKFRSKWLRKLDKKTRKLEVKLSALRAVACGFGQSIACQPRVVFDDAANTIGCTA